MKTTLLALTLSLTASAALAQPRPYTPRMSCNSASQMVTTNGAVIADTGPNTFDRFVRDRSFCTPSEETIPAFVPSADNRQCFIGWTCREYVPENW